jgi:hypothetical protein
MTNKTQLLEMIATLCDRFPDWRFGQLVSNVAGWADVDIWDVEDDQLGDAIQNYLVNSEQHERHSLEPQQVTVP